MPAAQEILKAALSSHVVPLMRQHGFRRQGQRWGRWSDVGWHVVQVQSSMFSNRDALSCTLNVCVWSRDAGYLLDERYDEAKMATPAECHVQDRVGHLMPARQDTWWDVNADDNPDEIGATLANAIETYALPHLDALRSVEEICLRNERALSVHPPAAPGSVGLAVMIAAYGLDHVERLLGALPLSPRELANTMIDLKVFRRRIQARTGPSPDPP